MHHPLNLTAYGSMMTQRLFKVRTDRSIPHSQTLRMSFTWSTPHVEGVDHSASYSETGRARSKKSKVVGERTVSNDLRHDGEGVGRCTLKNGNAAGILSCGCVESRHCCTQHIAAVQMHPLDAKERHTFKVVLPAWIGQNLMPQNCSLYAL